MSKFSNIIKMMNLLIVNERMNRSQLAKELGVSERMIRKYIDDFKEANIEINSFTGPKGGYEINLNNEIELNKEIEYIRTIRNLEKENLRLKEQIKRINGKLNILASDISDISDISEE